MVGLRDRLPTGDEKGPTMEKFHEYMDEYKAQMQKGIIPRAYRGLMAYITDLRSYFSSRYPEHTVSGSIYQGYMDMTYFAFTPGFLKDRGLKIAIVFNHEAFRFEIWLAGFNKKVQAQYWKLFKDSGWNRYHTVPATKGVDAIIEHTLVDDPDFGSLDALTRKIEYGTLAFIRDVEAFFLDK